MDADKERTDVLMENAKGSEAVKADDVPHAEHPGESTGEMMLKAKRSGRKGLLIGIAAVAVAVIAAVALLGGGGSGSGGTGGGGSGGIGGNGYEEKVALGEKYFAEGNYEQAEVTFLEAIGMNDREPRARRGLAYTYAVRGKFDEAKTVYDELFEETGEQIYSDASAAVANGRLPANAELIPIPDEYRELTQTALAESAGTYYADFTEPIPDPVFDDFTIYEFDPEASRVELVLNADGTFTVTADQYEWFVQGHAADGDIVYREMAQGQYVCIGQDESGAYILKLVSFQDTGTPSDDEYGDAVMYKNHLVDEEYYVVMVIMPYNMAHGFTGDTFLLKDGTISAADGTTVFSTR